MKSIVLGIALLAGCHHAAADQCQVLTDKMLPIITQLSKTANKPVPDGMSKQLLDDQVSQCILTASTDVAASACMQAGMSDYASKSKDVEGKVQLGSLARSVKAYYVENATFPVATTPLTPATPCCQQPTKMCAPNASDWAGKPWTDLNFQAFEPARFQYSYQSDGKTVTIKAVGDLACDGHPTEHTLSASVDASGAPTTTIDGK